MPSGHKKRKFLKQKNKSSAPPSSQGDGTKGKEKHSIPEKDAVGNGNKEKRGENSIFEFKGAETASGGEIDTSGNERSPVYAIATTEIPSEAENSQKFDVFKIPELDKSSNELQETEKSQLFETNGFSDESVARYDKVGWTGGLEEKGSEDQDVKEVVMGNSLEEAITAPVKECVPVNKQGGAEQAAAKNEEVIFAHEVDVSVCEKEDKLMIAAHGSMQAPQDGERDAILPRIEISHPPLAVRRASVWNCCGLFEVFKASQH